ncbi:Xylose isomerase-like TIM barrel [Aquimixticola soesokkakensis]|uniref:Xylose isomerase-like TIM barrel n=1 Tax=Aquimixticola soesokkakensis TaxID=1519096 RepID=A0A1Y5TNG2_9RHOB|nr:TIM barrel protein [Aquimixticola soesokkakensis]SLN67764.1 Xylose isomerase-like TIM barrel [Aquimixticola soesokkakensis]
MRFALNQKTAKPLAFGPFLDMAARLGCLGVEPRTDLGRPLFDGIDPEAAGDMARARGLVLCGLSEVYGFNVWDSTREAQVVELVAQAQASGARHISLIPSVDSRPTIALVEAMRHIAPLVARTGVEPLIEPIGFATSSLARKRPLVAAMDKVGGFRLVHDTFQHRISGEQELFPDHTALVHISGVVGPQGPLDATQDAHRVLLDAQDCTGALAQISDFEARGYAGAYSVECTTAAVWQSPTLEQDLADSFAYLRAHCAP